jgi:prophage antirepressor-like protein
MKKNTIYISQPGVISLIVKSGMQEAEAFQDFLFDKVIPSILNTG